MFYYGSNCVWHVGLLGVAILNFVTALWILLSITRGGRAEQFLRVLCYCNTVSNSPLCYSSKETSFVFSTLRHCSSIAHWPVTLLILRHEGASTTDCHPNSYVLPPEFASQKSNKMNKCIPYCLPCSPWNFLKLSYYVTCNSWSFFTTLIFAYMLIAKLVSVPYFLLLYHSYIWHD
jgi:hypothetical protein